MAARQHVRQHGVDAVKHPLHVHIQHLIPLLGRLFGKGGKLHLARVIDDKIHRPKANLCLGDGFAQSRTIGHVYLTTLGIGEPQRFKALDAASQEEQGVASLGKEGGAGGTNP
ncbi:hypothetical protein VAWG006_35160 [Aeromonas enteropelogenes]|nr:hypothetical protein VAWG006_35160 [Aeromonas enteropelogenes]BEE23426.1 hypothetical protein VAWG007_35210 [Aeromonas enteropelogenes]